MSLMDEMKNVVTIGRELFTTVSGKMKEIDDKVDSAVKEIPSEIIKNMGLVLYLDQINGSDSNDGRASTRAFKTMNKVASKTPPGGSVEIRLLSDYTFADFENNQFENNNVWIRSFGISGRYALKFSGVIGSAGDYTCNNFYAKRNCFFNLYQVDLHFPEIPTGDGSWNQQSAVIGSNSGADVGTPLSIRLSNVEIVVPDSANNRFAITPGYGIVIISTSSVVAPSDWVNAGRALVAMPAADQRVKARVIYDQGLLLPTT